MVLHKPGAKILSAGIFFLTSASACFASDLTFSNSSLHPVEITPEKVTGLNKIYVLYNTDGVKINYESSSTNVVKWYRYSNLGGAYAEEITDVDRATPGVTSVAAEGNMGYIIEDGDQRYYYWVVNYLPTRFSINSISVADDSDCDFTRLNFDGNAAPIHYFTINGQQRTLDREIKVSFDTQEWDEQSSEFVRTHVEKILPSIENVCSITPPHYCATAFTVSGDRFLTAWNWAIQAETPVAEAVAVQVHATATQQTTSDSDTPSNQIKTEDSGLGGSAPADITFHAAVTEGVIHDEWQMSRDPEFENVEYRFNERDLNYTFRDEGTFYLRYIGSNSAGSCEAISETFTVNIGTSELLCPNVFSPDGDGVNDEWKVSYRSIIDFKCWIFNRNGQQMCYFDSPDKGWDGKYHGKAVPSGVYYYVIQATGADGRKFKESGDINILLHKRGVQSTQPQQ